MRQTGLPRSDSKGVRGSRIADWRIADSSLRPRDVATSGPPSPALVGRFGICAEDCAERTTRGLGGP
eukprot:10757947-Alexandrium_andersonii.AAC.1